MKKHDLGLSMAILGLFLCILPVWIGAGASYSEIILQEDFNDGIAQGFGNEAGDWRIVNGRYTATRGRFRFSTVSESISSSDYCLEADFINASDGGLMLRAQDEERGIVLIVRPTDNDIYWAEVYWATGKGRGWVARHEISALGHKPGEDLHIRVTVRGDEFKAYVNGQLKTILRSTQFPKPKIALYLYHQSAQYWDNVIVRSLGDPSPEKKEDH